MMRSKNIIWIMAICFVAVILITLVLCTVSLNPTLQLLLAVLDGFFGIVCALCPSIMEKISEK